MSKKRYRVEVIYPSRGSPKHYLVKDVWYGGKKRKVRKYIGVKQPTLDELDHYRKTHAYWIEHRAAIKKAELSVASYNSRYLNGAELKTLEEMRHIYSTFTKLLTINEISAYEQDFTIHYVQGTTAIEGNTLTIEETANLLLYGIIPKEKPLREINEVQNFKKVLKHTSTYSGKVTLDFIRDIHEMVMTNIDNESAGQFRRVDNIVIGGCDISVVPSVLIIDELKGIINDYYTNIEQGCHPFEEAVLFHYYFEIIHPFSDGNGRVGREVFNYLISKAGFPKMLFLGKDRDKYIEALIHGNKEEFAQMVGSFASIIFKQRLSKLLNTLEKIVLPPPLPRSRQLSIEDYITL